MSRYNLHIYFGFLELVIKPDSLLLEDRGSWTGIEGHAQ